MDTRQLNISKNEEKVTISDEYTCCCANCFCPIGQCVVTDQSRIQPFIHAKMLCGCIPIYHKRRNVKNNDLWYMSLFSKLFGH